MPDPKPAQRAFVAGATGLTGRHVVRHLRALGHEVVAHVRPGSPRWAEHRASFEALGVLIERSPWERDDIARALATHRPGLVFGLLGTTQARIRAARHAGDAANAGGYAEVDAAMTKMVIDAAARVLPPPRFVYLSAAGAGRAGKGAYYDARTEVEAHLRESGLPFTIARPSFIVGERDDPRALERIGAPVATAVSGLLRLVGARRAAEHVAPMTGETLAAALCRLALDPAWANRIAENEDLAS